jgi:diguanylate cyclase (GGDEF)-like protein/PAS domain S-box-containing protein
VTRIGIIEYDLEGRAIYANASWRRLTGCDAPLPIPGDVLIELVHPDDRGEAVAAWEDALADPRPIVRTLRFQRPEGTVLHVDLHVDPVFRDGGHHGFVASAVDVSERHRAALAVRESEDRLSRLVDQAPVGQVITDLDGTIVQANQALGQILRRDPDALIGHSAAEFPHPDDLEKMQVDLAGLRANERDRSEIELRVVRADDEVAWVRAATSVVRDHADRPQYVHVVIHDITEKKEAELALRDSETRYRTMVDSLHDGVLVYEAGRITAANRSAAEILDAAPAELLADPEVLRRSPPVHPDGRPFEEDERPGVVAMAESRPVSDIVMGIDLPERGRRWISMNAWPLFDEADQPTGVVVSMSDITERKEAEDRLRESEERYRHLVESSPIGQLLADMNGIATEANQRMAEILGIDDAAELVGKGPLDMVHPDNLDELAELTVELVEERIERFTHQTRLLRPDGQNCWAVATTTLLRDAAGQPSNFLTLVQDITKRREAEEESHRLANIVESTSDLVGLIDYPSGELLYLNRAAREVFGFLETDLTGVDSRSLYADSVTQVFAEQIAPAVRRGESWTGELDMCRADGTPVPVLQTVTGEVDADGEIVRLWSVGRDITERKRMESQLTHRATHDPLTDLPNRTLLLEHLERSLGRTRRGRSTVALLYLDLDRFKAVNDNLGHVAGDELLVKVSQRIRGALRPSDVLARLGGDEFVVLCEGVDDEHGAVAVAQRVAAAIESSPFELRGAAIEETVSIGIALATDHHTHPEALLRDADAAMYRAKDRGRARHELFDEAMRQRSAQRLEVADELAAAIERGHITVHYQPILDLTSGEVTGVEALARWSHPTRGTLPPYEFIGVAEETGLIVGLGLAVLTQTCDQVRRWEVEMGSHAPRVHVNLSARQLTHTSLPSLVAGVLEQSLVSPDRICFEITESVLMEDAAKSVASLEELKDIGVELAIDDFGTGYSSLAYLRRFPVDVLKVDRSFVDGLGPDPHDSSIVAAIVNLAHTLGLVCVAEGVETDEQLAGLRGLGCDAAQGYLFARPAPVPDVNQHLRPGVALIEPASPRKRWLRR